MCTRKGQSASAALLASLTAAFAMHPYRYSKIESRSGQRRPPLQMLFLRATARMKFRLCSGNQPADIASVHNNHQRARKAAEQFFRQAAAEQQRTHGKADGGRHGADRGSTAEIRGSSKHRHSQKQHAPVQHDCHGHARRDGLTAAEAKVQREAVANQRRCTRDAHPGVQ